MKKQEWENYIVKWKKGIKILLFCYLGTITLCFALLMIIKYAVNTKDNGINLLPVTLGIMATIPFIILMVNFKRKVNLGLLVIEKMNWTESILNSQNEIISTKILATYQKSDNDMVRHNAIWFGVIGAIATQAATQATYTTFLIKYKDETQDTIEVPNGTTVYNHFIKYLDI